MSTKSRTGRIRPASFGPWALITGASSGIGKEFAVQLAANGFHLVLAARRIAALDALAAELRAVHRVDCRTMQVDLSQHDAASAIERDTRDLDVGLVISNAGAGVPGRFLDASLDTLHEIVQLNTIAQLDLAHHFGRRLARRGRGGLLLVGALGGSEGIPLMANAGATKAFVHSLGNALHVELAGRGVSVCVLIPGPTDTPVLDTFGIERLPIRPVPVAACVSEALRALAIGRPEVVPGRLIRFVHAIAPRSVIRRRTMEMFARGIEAKARHALDRG